MTNKPEIIKGLYNAGYPQKVIRFITHCNQAYISKVVNEKISPLSQPSNELEPTELRRKEVIDKLLLAVKIPTLGITDQDKIYIQILKQLMMEKEVVHKTVYPALSTHLFHKLWTQKDIDILDFQSEEMLGINKEAFDDTFNIE